MTAWYSWAFDGVAGSAAVAIGIAVYQRRSAKRDRVKSVTLFDAGEILPVMIESPITARVTGPTSESQVAVGNNISQSFEVHQHFVHRELSRVLIPSDPGPEQIKEDLRRLKPFELHRSSESYRGLSVLWALHLSAISPHYDGWLIFGFGGREGNSALVGFEVSTLRPELKLAEMDSLVWVSGKIRKAEIGTIWLEEEPEILRIEPPAKS